MEREDVGAAKRGRMDERKGKVFAGYMYAGPGGAGSDLPLTGERKLLSRSRRARNTSYREREKMTRVRAKPSRTFILCVRKAERYARATVYVNGKSSTDE